MKINADDIENRDLYQSAEIVRAANTRTLNLENASISTQS